METTEALGVFAQIGIALAGFSSIGGVVSHANDREQWHADIFRFKSMLQFGLGSAGLAMLPAVLQRVFADEAVLWRVLDGVMALALLACLRVASKAGSKLQAGRLSPFVFALNSLSIGGALVLQFFGALGRVDGASAYLIAVGVMCGVSGLMFYRLTTRSVGADE